MALHSSLPRSPCEPLDPAHRWFPADAAPQPPIAAGRPIYRFAYVDQDGFDRHPPSSLAELLTMFREHRLWAPSTVP